MGIKADHNQDFQRPITANDRSNGICRRWFICVTACISMMLDIGFMFSFGTLYVNIMTTFNVGRSEAAMVQSILMAVRFGAGMISGAIVQRFGTLYAGVFGSCLACTGLSMSYFATSVLMLDITMGFVLAIGSSCLYIASSMTIGQHFSSETRHILLSIQSAAGGVGGMAYPFVLKYLSDNFGLKGSLLLVGGVYLQLLPATLLWRDSRFHKKSLKNKSIIEQVINEKSKEEANEENTNDSAGQNGKIYEDAISCPEMAEIASNHEVETARETDFNDTIIVIESRMETAMNHNHVKTVNNQEAARIHKNQNGRKESILKCLKALACNSSFVLFAVGLAIAYPSLNILFIFVVDLFLDAGLSADDAIFGLLLVHLFSIFGRLLPGLVMQSRHVPALSVPICAAIVSSAAMAGLVVVEGFSEHLLLLSLIGIPYGVFVSVFSVTTLKLVGIERLPNAIGVHFTLNGIGSALAGPISGALRDYTGSYTYPFWIASGVILVGAIFFTVALQIRRKKNREVTERTPLLENVNYRLESSTIF